MHRLNVKGWKKIFHANGNKKVGIGIFTSDKIDFKTKAIKKDKKGHCVMIKGSRQEEDIILLDNNTIIVEDFNTPLTSMGRSSRKKINKATEVLK